MSSSAQFLGGARVSSLAGSLSGWYGSFPPLTPAIATASGAMTAGVWKTLVSVTGTGGALRMVAAITANATSKTLAVRITRDGVVIFDKTSGTVSAAALGLMAYGRVIGGAGGSSAIPSDGDELLFDSSMLVEVKSSVTETDGFNFYVNYDLRG